MITLEHFLKFNLVMMTVTSITHNTACSILRIDSTFCSTFSGQLIVAVLWPLFLATHIYFGTRIAYHKLRRRFSRTICRYRKWKTQQCMEKMTRLYERMPNQEIMFFLPSKLDPQEIEQLHSILLHACGAVKKESDQEASTQQTEHNQSGESDCSETPDQPDPCPLE